ncbi:MAG: hypothetical protein AAF503_09945 [Pseudomonadota bacterium]
MTERTLLDRLGPDPVDATWKRLTSAGRAAFEAGDFGHAGDLYDRALQEAHQRFLCDRGTDTMADAPPMLVAAYANAAECHMRRGNPWYAARLASEAVAALCTAMDDEAEHPAFRLACLQHLIPSLNEYAERAQTARIPRAKFQREVMHARKTALAFLSENQTRH